jgi:hypothetical protein
MYPDLVLKRVAVCSCAKLLEEDESVEHQLKSSLEDADVLRAGKKSVETRFEERDVKQRS